MTLVKLSVADAFVFDFVLVGNGLLAAAMYLLYEPYLGYSAIFFLIGLTWAVVFWHGTMSLIAPISIVALLGMAALIRLIRGQHLVELRPHRVSVWILVPAFATSALFVGGVAASNLIAGG